VVIRATWGKFLKVPLKKRYPEADRPADNSDQNPDWRSPQRIGAP